MSQSLLDQYRPNLLPYEELYKHFHTNPELSELEEETAKTIAEHLTKLSPDLQIATNIGGFGVIAVCRNGPGKTVLLRADFDALPIAEKTGLEYASTKKMRDVSGDLKPVMHGILLYQRLRNTSDNKEHH